MKRLLAMIFSVLLLASVLPVAASAAESNFPFTDVPQDHYARWAIEYMYETGLMKGTGNNLFSPEGAYSRAQFVTMLGRLEGIDPDQYKGSDFRDVPENHWAAPYINWASRNNVVNGVGQGRFAPSSIITEEQYCTIVCRYLDAKGLDFPGEPVWTPEIADMAQVSTWAKSSVVNMVYYNLVGLSYDFWFLPQREMTRDNIAVYFSNLYIMLTEGVCPQETYDASESIHLESQDIVAIATGAAAYLGNWFYFNSYTDPNDTMVTGYGPFERVTNPYVNTKAKLVEQGYQYFLFDVSQVLKEGKAILERNHSLYLSQPDGLGGFLVDQAYIDVDSEGDSYVLTIRYYSGDEWIDTQQTQLFYDGERGRWVFTDLIYPDLAAVGIEVAWG